MTTHVLDAARGRPAVGVTVRLESWQAGGWRAVTEKTTDADGRIGGLADAVEPGEHRLVFDTGRYFEAAGVETFFPEVVVAFTVREGSQRHHVPLLVSPYSYTTYRGS